MVPTAASPWRLKPRATDERLASARLRLRVCREFSAFPEQPLEEELGGVRLTFSRREAQSYATHDPSTHITPRPHNVPRAAACVASARARAWDTP